MLAFLTHFSWIALQWNLRSFLALSNVPYFSWKSSIEPNSHKPFNCIKWIILNHSNANKQNSVRSNLILKNIKKKCKNSGTVRFGSREKYLSFTVLPYLGSKYFLFLLEKLIVLENQSLIKNEAKLGLILILRYVFGIFNPHQLEFHE